MRREVFISSLFYSQQFCWGPKGCIGWQVESPKMASVLLTNEGYQKVKKQQRLYEKWHKWKGSRIADRRSVQDDFSRLFTAHRRVTLHRGIQQRTPLKVTLVTEPIKTKTSQTCLESNLSRTWGHFTQVWNCGTLLWQQQSFPFPCLLLTLCFLRRWEESCLFYVMIIIMWRVGRSLAF